VCERDDRLAGPFAVDDLDAFHHRYGVHEVEPDHVARAVGRGGDGRDRERRGVAREDDPVVDDLIQLGEHLAFHLEVLDDRLDHEVGLREVPERRRPTDPLADRLRLLFEPIARCEPVQAVLDGVEAAIDVVPFDVAHDHLIAGGGRGRGDPVAHRARPDNADDVDIAQLVHANRWRGWVRKPCGRVCSIRSCGP